MVDASSSDPRTTTIGHAVEQTAPRFVANLAAMASETVPIVSAGLSDWQQNELPGPSWPAQSSLSAEAMLSQIGCDLAMARLTAGISDFDSAPGVAAHRIGHYLLGGNLELLDAEVRNTVLNPGLGVQAANEFLAELNQALNVLGFNVWADWSVNNRKLRQTVLTGFSDRGVAFAMDSAPKLYGMPAGADRMIVFMPAARSQVIDAMDAIRANAVDWLLGRNPHAWEFYAEKFKESHGQWGQSAAEYPHTYPGEVTSMVGAFLSHNLKEGRSLGLGFDALKEIADKFVYDMNGAFETASHMKHLRTQVKWERTFMLDGSGVRNAQLVWFEKRGNGLQGCDQYLGLQTIFVLKEPKIWARI